MTLFWQLCALTTAHNELLPNAASTSASTSSSPLRRRIRSTNPDLARALSGRPAALPRCRHIRCKKARREKLGQEGGREMLPLMPVMPLRYYRDVEIGQSVRSFLRSVVHVFGSLLHRHARSLFLPSFPSAPLPLKSSDGNEIACDMSCGGNGNVKYAVHPAACRSLPPSLPPSFFPSASD